MGPTYFDFIRMLTSCASLRGRSALQQPGSCDRAEEGYGCQPNISHYWGQYSPYYSIPSEITPNMPTNCNIIFAQVLSRHGARDPTKSKTIKYKETVQKIKSNVQRFEGDYAFLVDYKYILGADQLTNFGEQQLVNSGNKYYNRYKTLTKDFYPFVRASSQERVVMSAENFTQGYMQAALADTGRTIDPDTHKIVIISEAPGSNNTLDHGLCKDFEELPAYDIGKAAQETWQDIFMPPITARLNANLPGANLTSDETIFFMDLCPFNTVASPFGEISPFCNLFTPDEWRQYDYYQSLGKYYGYGSGNPLGPTQGVGYVNELVARLTSSPVDDHTSVNHTLDDANATFPIGAGHPLFADFSHDNDMTAILSALGLYNATKPLLNTTIEMTPQTNGYSASWTVPFAARAYFEKMACAGVDEEFVRVLVNDRVLPLETCGGDALGRCTLGRFVESLNFARRGGRWDQCFV